MANVLLIRCWVVGGALLPIELLVPPLPPALLPVPELVRAVVGGARRVVLVVVSVAIVYRGGCSCIGAEGLLSSVILGSHARSWFPL
jgi:hypothetical protein